MSQPHRTHDPTGDPLASGGSAPRPRRWATAVWRYVRSAPGTYIWLAILLVTTRVLRHLDPEFEQEFLAQRSTNLHELATNPVRVLISSLFWLDGGGWLNYAFFYSVFHATAERWLGTWRWLLVLGIAHVGATYLSEGVLYLAIRHGFAPGSAVNTLDVGVSYALAGIEAVLAWLLVAPWRYLYLAVILASYGQALISGRTFTDVGHFTAALLGLACYPLVRDRAGRWDPPATVRGLRTRWRRHA
ncbi:rhomboid-like protein [Embleya sp. AB8]|uniref:rhomboid-like protein n=1 Tax=Embleya sp. AB8 TaxID=3156304 RepID=UPI003C769D83